MPNLISHDITLAAQLLSAGSLIIFPTETVYGIGADARNEVAVQNIFNAKRRPATNPLIVHIGDLSQLEEWAMDIPAASYQLAKEFWPGPLTIVLKKHPQVTPLITGGQNTIALRMPNHPVARDLLKAFGSGIAAPSANPYTHLSPTSTSAIDPALAKHAALILEGGQCEVGLESTILDMSTETSHILRPGMISTAAIEAALAFEISKTIPEKEPRVPGNHPIHYAPKTKTRLLTTTSLALLESVTAPTVLLHHSQFPVKNNLALHTILMPTQPEAYARVLYHNLHSADCSGAQLILIEEVPRQSSWDAIRDRITKASAR